MTTDHAPIPVGDRAASVDDYESRDFDVGDLPEGAPLARVCATSEEATLHGHASCALRTEWKHAGSQIVKRCLGKTLVGIDLVEPMPLEVVDDGAG